VTDVIRWSYNRELTRWEASLGGERIATAYVREGTPVGYWGRYRTTLYGKRGFATTLREFKRVVDDAVAKREQDREAVRKGYRLRRTS
jgi:hypothetical protein